MVRSSVKEDREERRREIMESLGGGGWEGSPRELNSKPQERTWCKHTTQ